MWNISSIDLWFHKIQVLSQIIMCVLALALASFLRSSKPNDKREQAAWRLECELGVIADPDCPVDGGWAAWEPWSPCRCSCDSVGHRRRTRRCNNPVPSEDGLPCDGHEEEIQQCYVSNCTVQDFRKLIEGDDLRIEAFKELEAVPALMERCLQMECPYETVESILSNDNTWQVSPETIWNALQCIKHNVGCPVIGEWSSWGEWSPCGARCGNGLRWRLRYCDTPKPSHAHLLCRGTPLDVEECKGDHCAVDHENIGNDNGQWSNWSQWSVCSAKCGAGVRRRQRICRDSFESRVVGSWGTYCIGQHDQFKVCENEKCLMDGGWSGWSQWVPCSQTCGAGRRTRTRSCTRPAPAGEGLPCPGPKTEVTSCYLIPCEVYSHKVTILNGESYLQYNFHNKRSVLFHFYVRFMPLSPHGTLVRRGSVHNPQVRLSLQKWHVCLDASGASKSCTLPRICSPSMVEPATWHTCLITVTSEAASLRLNDATVPIKAIFSCDPQLPDEKVNIFVGEKLHGELQEIVLNFIPLYLFMERRQRTVHDFYPSSASNIAYEIAGLEEGFLELQNDQYLRMPCFDEGDDWLLEITFKSKRDTGTLLFLWNDLDDSWLHIALQNQRLKLKVALPDYRSESISSTECPSNQWLDVTLRLRRNSNTIEASINSDERLHIVLDEDNPRKRRTHVSNNSYPIETNNKSLVIGVEKECGHWPRLDEIEYKPMSVSICHDEFFIGGIPKEVQELVDDDYNNFHGTIASVSINGAMQDLQDVGVESCKEDKLQLSSKTASVSGAYHEIFWGKSNVLNLTCLHARSTRSPHTARWLFLDTSVMGVLRDITVHLVDGGKVLRLSASAGNDLRGFYTCRAHTYKRTRNIVTYGVLGKVKYNFTSPDTIAAIAMVTTIALALTTLTWLIFEVINDLRKGYGFFRDSHLTPEEEADAVCAYIDNHIEMIGSKSAAMLAKERARRRGRQLASKYNFGAQEPQGMMQIETGRAPKLSDAMSTQSGPVCLPELPDTSFAETSHGAYRCDQSYMSSPRHGSKITTVRTNLDSSSSFEMSPRVLCSQLLLAKRIHSSREKLVSRRYKSPRQLDSSRLLRSNLLTIKSSTFVQHSPAHKILEKFHQLKYNDP